MRRRRYMQGSGEPPAIYNETDAKFYYRQTGGAIIDNSPLVGRFDKIKGNTIAWNQKYNSGSSSDFIWDGNGKGYIDSVTNKNVTCYDAGLVPTISGHKYYIYCSVVANVCTNGSATFYFSYVTPYISPQEISPENLSFTLKVVRQATGDYITYRKYTNFTASGVSVLYQFIDLTLIYGSGNEPSTPAQFEADYFKWFGKPLTYEPYDEGSLRSVKMSGLKTVGFNQWDEEWESGSINYQTGALTISTPNSRSKNYIPIIGGKTYFIKNPVAANLTFYDSNKSFIHTGTTYINKKDFAFVVPENARYLKFALGITTYNNDICINISDTNKNGTYETHWSETKNIPITTLTGKVNGQGESVVVFPDGMLSAGDVHDEIYKQGSKTYAIKRVGKVDLGSLSWNAYTDGGTTVGFYANISDKSKNNSLANVLSSRYSSHSVNGINISVLSEMIDKSIAGYYNPSGTNSWLYLKDTAYSSASNLTAALDGVPCYYELATPIIYELDGFTLPVSYNCAALGTEEILPENNSTPASVAPIVDTSYRVGHVAEKPWYGIKWSEDNGQIQRIASNMELHATLPIQSKMKRCMLLDNGSVYKYISDADPFLYEDGTSVKYDGTDGQVMVEVPAYWYTAYKETDENNITWNYLKLYPKGGGQMYSRKIYRGAFEMITDNSDNSDNSVAKGCSVSMLDFASMGTTKDTTSFVASAMKYLSAATSYRNWNYANVDATNVKNSLGKPTTGRNRATFRSIAARRGAGFSQEYWDSYNSLIRLYVVEYCNFDIQAAINDSPTVEGFRQGGLGAGVTNANSTRWNNFNNYNSFVPCGVTVPLGNKSGAVSYAFVNDDFDDVSIAYSVPSYRGIENPFGHIWKFIDGFNRKGKVDNSVTTEMIYVCDIVSKFAENDADGYILQSDSAPRANGSFGGVDWNAKGTFWPKPDGRTMYSDYFYNAYANNTWYTLYGGGNADAGSVAGLFCLRATTGSGGAFAAFGSRLLFTK